MSRQVCCAMLAAFLILSLGAAAWAQNPAPAGVPKVGVFDIRRAIIESEEGKKAAEKLQSQFTGRRNELQAMQAEVEKLQKQLREQEKALSDEARANLVRQIESKTKEFTRKNEDATNDFQQAEGQVINDIGQRVMKVLDEYARKNGYHILLDITPQGPVLWASTAVDVTDEVIKLYNAAAPAPAASPGAKQPAGSAAPAPRPGGATGTSPPAAKQPAPAAKKPAPPPQ